MGLIVMIGMVVTQRGVVEARFNEFDISAANFDKLQDHNRNCTAELDDEVVVIYCEDGYFAIDEHYSFFDKESK